MKRQHLYTAIFLLLTLAMASRATISLAQKNNPLPEGWFKYGKSPDHYTVSLDHTVYRSGSSSGLIASNTTHPTGFGTLMHLKTASLEIGKETHRSIHLKKRMCDKPL